MRQILQQQSTSHCQNQRHKPLSLKTPDHGTFLLLLPVGNSGPRRNERNGRNSPLMRFTGKGTLTGRLANVCLVEPNWTVNSRIASSRLEANSSLHNRKTQCLLLLPTVTVDEEKNSSKRSLSASQLLTSLCLHIYKMLARISTCIYSLLSNLSPFFLLRKRRRFKCLGAAAGCSILQNEGEKGVPIVR